MDMNARGKKTAQRLLALRANGGNSSTIVIKKESVSYDPITGVEQVVTPSIELTGSAYKTDFKDARVAESNVKLGDVRFLVSPVLADGTDCPSIVVGDVLTHTGKDWIVIDVKEVSPAGLIIYQDVHARKLSGAT